MRESPHYSYSLVYKAAVLPPVPLEALSIARGLGMRASGSSGRAGTTEDLGGIVTVSTLLYSILTRPPTDRLSLSQSSAEPQVGLFRDPVSGNLVTDFVSFS